eukprot:CAMPEP_0196577482 /NCGR_PEP_ID=MMETSP1081-20130531/6548_1 /TAXON_ID=36882 /ORGANISM="Pyramimonas amylifera, Strain CCMP720" /LENGTH=225 /DNA_ID=CAMNT_0041896425 /DNA_START=547 /DNA_END=1227 /DNA_ORIENTATION=+
MGNNLFKSSKKSITENDRAILNIKVQKRKLLEYQKRVENAASVASEGAKRLVAEKQRERARTELRKKKYMEQTLDRIDQQVLKMDEMLLNIQEAVQTSQVVERLKAGNVALKEIQKCIRVGDVEKLMDEISEGHANLDDVNELLQAGLSAEDIQTAESELDTLESEMFAEELPLLPTDLKMPEQKDKAPLIQQETLSTVEDGAAALRQQAGVGVVRQIEPEILAE